MELSEAVRKECISQKLKYLLSSRLPGNGIYRTPVPEVFMARIDKPGFVEHRLDRPLASLMAQGAKLTNIGGQEYSIRENDVIVLGIEMPSSSQIICASGREPIMTLFFYLNPQLIREVTLEAGWRSQTGVTSSGIALINANADLLNGFLRLCLLFDKPDQIPVLAPLILKELHYLLLLTPARGALATLCEAGGDTAQLFKAIEYLKANLASPVPSSELASKVHMSESSLYRHFKRLTGLSPLQYQKQLRLHEARRLILAENEQAGQAALRVGYQSVTQFNREYKRLFGQPPRKSKLWQA